MFGGPNHSRIELIKWLSAHVVETYHLQWIATLMTYIICTTILLLCVALTVRVLCYLKREWLYPISIISILGIGSASGVLLGFCTMRVFDAASDIEQALDMKTGYFLWYTHAAAINLGIFFTSFNVAHWIFAMKYWVLSHKIAYILNEPIMKHLNTIIKVVWLIGFLLNFASGSLIVICAYITPSEAFQAFAKSMNIIPGVISCGIIIDALHRLRRLSKGVLQLETWQMVWHAWSFIFVLIAGVLLLLCSRKPWEHIERFYSSYYLLLILLFMCEIPFIWILNRIVT